MKFVEYDAAKYLTDEETIAFYLTDALENGSEAEFLLALKNVAKARGMTQLAKDSGVPRESLYKTLSGESKPRFETITKIINALGVNLAFTPKITNV
ncbi:addiction module antidote protein [Aggregatibacter actinomycetemcomitans]|uniref:addiction module antidote protein n=1 Tax=Aggregatibacter actinomycetemcomitans TaxID=714 RepID=UPI00023FEF0E|nr:addiction module antidote protein [Aggregatibacter actinomycetemcomitans]EHK89942.1 addiction module antidote protein [Aggregatibacter actinomycetemcomitans RhAA1]KNE77032.1 addiction module antitoxin [Aggregatibacter actinomycetemcomitans RhAA1]MBN6079402.1 putative addiction module antidote protein [Aggregatibacter actinomycetemcomitans]